MRKTHHLLKSNLEDTEVTFGAVTVRVHAPDMELVKRNIKEGQEALMRAQAALVKPGVKLLRSKGKPIFFATPDHLDIVVREVDGVRTLGKFVGGRFRVIKESNSAVKRATAKRASSRVVSAKVA